MDSQDSNPKKADVEARLHETAEAMSGRLSSIQDEVESTGLSVRNWIANNPLKSVGGMLAAGLAVGLVFGGGRSRRRQRHRDLIENYLDAVRTEVETAVDRGEEPGAALQEALRDRVPMIVYSGEEERSGGGWTGLLGDGARIVFRTGLSLMARDVLEGLLAETDINNLVDEEALS
jgi:ElaB/YqjD/DUF883 family membrane-anchored ribosome-binding protein